MEGSGGLTIPSKKGLVQKCGWGDACFDYISKLHLNTIKSTIVKLKIKFFVNSFINLKTIRQFEQIHKNPFFEFLHLILVYQVHEK